MTETLKYTRKASPDSEAVDQAWYDDEDHNLYLELHGTVYKYANVPAHAYEDLVSASSAGQFYQRSIRPYYGPAVNLGSSRYLTKVTRLGLRTNEPVKSVFTYQVEQVQDTKVQASGTSKQVADGNVYLSLKKVAPAVPSGGYDHHFTFTVAGVEGVKTHSVKAEGMDQAIEQLFALGKTFNQDITLKSVTVNFD